MAERESESYLFALLVVAAELVDCRIRVRLRCERERKREREKNKGRPVVGGGLPRDAAADEVMLSSSNRGKERGEKGEEEKGLKQNKKKAEASLRKSIYANEPSESAHRGFGARTFSEYATFKTMSD